jgi:hypothetical protein
MIVQASMRASERASERACTRLRLLRGLLEGGLRKGFRGDNVAAATALKQRRFFDDAVTTVQWHGVMIMARRQSTVHNVAATRSDQNEDIDSNAAMKAKMTTETTVSQRYLRRRLGTSTKTKIQAATATALTPTAMAWRLLTATTAQRQRNNSAATAQRQHSDSASTAQRLK